MLSAGATRPVQERTGFQKVMLKRGESKTFTFRRAPDTLKFYSNDLKFVAEPGDFQVMGGVNFHDMQMASFKLVVK